METNRFTGLIIFLMLLIPGVVSAQEFSVSPYSVFGIGDTQLGDGGRFAGMAGTGISLRGNRFVNTNNPAALTSLDSTTFLFDVSASGKGSVFTSGGIKEKAFNANFTKIAAGMRVTPHWCLGVFIKPYSTVSYKIQTEDFVEGTLNNTATTTYDGSGGLTGLNITNSFSLGQNLSIGFNTSFLFGGIERRAEQNDISIKESSNTSKVLFDFGLQYYKTIGDYRLGFGAVGSYRNVLTYKNSRIVLDENGNEKLNINTADSQFTIPESFGAGISLSKGAGFFLAADYRFQRWSLTTDHSADKTFKNTHKVSAGIAFIPDELYASNYLEVMQYQFGVSVSNSYLVLNGENPTNYEVSAGAGMPFKGGTMMNVAFSYGKKGTLRSGLIREDFFRITMTFSISERWFVKRLYD